MADASNDAEPSSAPLADSILSTLKPPPPYSVSVHDLTICAPVIPWTIPLGVPVPVPAFIRRAIKGKDNDEIPRELVRSVNLQVVPGEVLAIIGGSGSGKATLLTALACRLSNLTVSSGSVSFTPAGSSSTATASSFRAAKSIGYVRQDDFLIPCLTVRETLAFAAALRLPASVPPATRHAIVEQTLSELGLAAVADVIVGGAFRKGISGGERRRLSIGCILVTLPSVLVLDEPTTGLDASTAFQLLDTLSRLAKRGRVVILSIHQPRSDAFPLFDKTTLLSSGSVVYSGPTRDMLQHFARLGHTPPPHTNPLDFVVDISSIDTRTDESEALTRERVGGLVREWKEVEVREGTVGDRSKKEGGGISGAADAEKGLERVVSGEGVRAGVQEKRVGFLRQTVLLTRRGLLNVSRDYGQIVGFFLQAIIIGVALGLAFLNPPATPGGVQTLKTIVYQSTPAFFYLSIIISVFLHTGALVVFDREREDGLYGTVAWVTSLLVAAVPAAVGASTLYGIIVYFMCGFRRDDLAKNLLSFIADCIMQQFAAWSYALLAASISRSFAQASLLANGFSIPFILSSGYLILDLPVWVRWTRWISPYFYGFNWMARLQFQDRTFACVGITGAARNACDGNAVLRGLRFNLATPLFVFPLGILGFILVTTGFATLLLQVYHPGGVKHAGQHHDSKSAAGADVVIVEKTEAVESAVVPPKERVDVAVEGLELTVSKRSVAEKGGKVDKTILEEVNAFFPSGKVSVIMGPSGAGKSSLLQLLAGRLNSGVLSDFKEKGAILLNGRKFGSSMASLVAFVAQEDAHHLPALTVRETLRYAAALRLRGLTKAQRDARAEEVLRMLGLKPCADNLVGGELIKGISGGEKRRLSLAVELISDPPILYADEPLSGLDAFTAHNVMLTLKSIAASGRTVVVSVHQPSTDIWRLFDNVLLLVKGGRSAYSGPRKDILKVFEAAGEACPENFNPADFILDTISIDHRSVSRQAVTQERVSRITDLWQRQAREHGRQSREVTTEEQGVSMKRTAAPILTAFPVVLGRSFKNLRRQSDVLVARLVNPPFMALLFWLFFARLNRGPSGAQDRVGLLQETAALPFVGMLACIAIFPTERNLFFHEWKSSGRQSVSTFVLAYTVQEALVSIVASLLFSIVFVYGVGLRHSPRIFTEFWFTIFALISTGESIGIMFCSFFNNGGIAVSLVSAALTILSQASAHLINGIISVTLPKWLEVIGWASPMKSQSRINIINEMHGLTFNCTADDISSGLCIAATGDQLLATFSIGVDGTTKYIGILAGLIVIFRLLAVLALRLRMASQ
ncbi:hypothetical protein PLICRDRAFT_132994 [Plicaturopsis crispa FD-325 SS-3]|nr:hypothetical protein PLICRDRAFT_132994 [Plicaturopsis crispa FD-325 SS-3]